MRRKTGARRRPASRFADAPNHGPEHLPRHFIDGKVAEQSPLGERMGKAPHAETVAIETLGACSNLTRAGLALQPSGERLTDPPSRQSTRLAGSATVSVSRRSILAAYGPSRRDVLFQFLAQLVLRREVEVVAHPMNIALDSADDVVVVD